MSTISGPGTPAHVDPSAPATPATPDSGGGAGAATVGVVRDAGGARLGLGAALARSAGTDELRLADDAASFVEGALARLSSAQAARARALLLEAATLDGNLVASRSEAERALEPVLRALPDGGAAIGAAIRDVDEELDAERAREAELRDGVDAIFNSDTRGPSITERVVAELDAAVAEADGRRLDINIMIFSFTDKAISDKLEEIARDHPNANVKIIADWTQTTTANGYKPAALARLGLPNLEVKFKKDQPYKYDDATGRLEWDHATSRGLNHHKGFVTLIDGKPRSLVAGSFNWSPTAERTNYENLMVVDASAAANRTVMRHYEEEFEAYWNDGKATLTLAEAGDHKRRIEREFRANPGAAPSSIKGLEAGAGASIDLLAAEDVLDVNGWGAGERIAALMGGGAEGNALARAIHAERLRFGRFRDIDDLVARVPDLARLSADEVAEVRREVVFGDGLVSLSHASKEELVAAGVSRDDADALVRAREAAGDFETLEEAREAAGIPESRWARASRHLSVESRRVSFSARRPDEATGDGGYARTSEERTVPVIGEDGVVRLESATLGAGAVDMLRRARPGETVKLATYGLSASTPEYAALVEAARRGCAVRVVLNRSGNEEVAERLKRLARDEGLDVKVKVSSRTMHQKYLVRPASGDAFNGSANLSGSSSTRHSEDRFFLKNMPGVARAFDADFERLWERLPGNG
jgi:phosphatidylserine/phosphatidylglycerophosphate/cardiolipin synthase-like enzyme